MGLMERVMNVLFGNGRNVLRETAGIFVENREEQAGRDAIIRAAALNQFSGEFANMRPSRFDRFIDALNRLPRPLLAFGTIGLFVSAMVEPLWFAERMKGIALVPEPLWWILGAIISFYFGARHQAKGQAFQRQMIQGLSRMPDVKRRIASSQALEAGAKGEGGIGDLDAERSWENASAPINDWRGARGYEGP